jgi:hypothetical protein
MNYKYIILENEPMKLKKIIAPVIITILLLVYLATYLWGWSHITAPSWLRAIGLIVPVCLMGVSIYVLIERIKEIRSGEEDDLSKY